MPSLILSSRYTTDSQLLRETARNFAWETLRLDDERIPDWFDPPDDQIVMFYTAPHADRTKVVSLWHCVFPNSTGHNDPDGAIDRKVTADDELFFVADDDGKIIGSVLAGYDGHRGWLYSPAVAPDQRRGGIGTRLVEQLDANDRMSLGHTIKPG